MLMVDSAMNNGGMAGADYAVINDGGIASC